MQPMHHVQTVNIAGVEVLEDVQQLGPAEAALHKIPLVLDPQPEGGYTITSPLVPGLVTEADTLDQVVKRVADALAALLELYEELGRPCEHDGTQAAQTGLPRDSSQGRRLGSPLAVQNSEFCQNSEF